MIFSFPFDSSGCAAFFTLFSSLVLLIFGGWRRRGAFENVCFAYFWAYFFRLAGALNFSCIYLSWLQSVARSFPSFGTNNRKSVDKMQRRKNKRARTAAATRILWLSLYQNENFLFFFCSCLFSCMSLMFVFFLCVPQANYPAKINRASTEIVLTQNNNNDNVWKICFLNVFFLVFKWMAAALPMLMHRWWHLY